MVPEFGVSKKFIDIIVILAGGVDKFSEEIHNCKVVILVQSKVGWKGIKFKWLMFLIQLG